MRCSYQRQGVYVRQKKVNVVGAGLAGSEAAFQLAKRGIEVDLFEMRPVRSTEAHTTANCAELVCSNSFGSIATHSASSILKVELELLQAFILSVAKEQRVPAGASLAVDRDKFSKTVTQRLEQLSLIRFHRKEFFKVPEDEITILATGPLTSPDLAKEIASLVGTQSLYFYDAISPIVAAESLDLDKMYFASRYGKGEADFLNIPLDKDQYFSFVDQLLKGEVVLPHDFEEEKYFESCLPIETIASRGPLTLAYGPMKPVGLEDPRTGKRPFAVIQLRAENKDRTAYNLVGFQTKLKYQEQQRIFKTLPGLENAELLRLGSMHRNTYVDSPRVLRPTLQLKNRDNVFLAGQLTGTEGYLESSATGLIAGVNAYRLIEGKEPFYPPPQTMLGALLQYVTDSTREKFQPVNSNFGILPALEERPRSREVRNASYENRALNSIKAWITGTATDASQVRPSENYKYSSIDL
jgi:methylenetetrahydrofolate--tRNA-(uracil-5-)-methyltransferase